jgi:NAD(P)-dependent dehydrogenase (short-subunit alcohol dehydrogenase family)
MTNDTLPAGRVAIVAGAAGELGRATAVKLADRGMTVVAVDRNGPGLDGLPDGIARELVEITEPTAAAPMVERVVIAPQLLGTARNRATFPKEVLAPAVAPDAMAELVAFLVSEAAAPISGAILPAYGA